MHTYTIHVLITLTLTLLHTGFLDVKRKKLNWVIAYWNQKSTTVEKQHQQYVINEEISFVRTAKGSTSSPKVPGT